MDLGVVAKRRAPFVQIEEFVFVVLPLLFILCGEGPCCDYAVQIEGGIEDGL